MDTSIPRFVNRIDELKTIRSHVLAWDTLRVLFVDGVGGIGKTRLLDQVYQTRYDYAEALGQKLRCTRVINLDDISLEVPMNLPRRLANELGASAFQKYLDETNQLIMMQSRGLLSSEAFQEKMSASEESFVASYLEIAEHERLLLLLDTFESIRSPALARNLLRLLAQVKNTFVILAGRNGARARGTAEQIIQEAGLPAVELDYMPLEAFEPEVARTYLDETVVGAYLKANPRLEEKLLVLTNRNPLLLALSAEWLRRDVPLPELAESSAVALDELPSVELEVLKSRFERALVSNIRALRGDLAEHILNMAHFSLRFDAELLAALSDESLDSCQRKIEMLQGLFFVKLKPEASIVLHDEMQRLVEAYVWQEIDPFRTRRVKLSEKAVRHYEERIAALDGRLESLQQMEEETNDIARVTAFRQEYLEKRMLRSLLIRELLRYTFDADPVRGLKLFSEQYDDASIHYQYILRDGLVQEMVRYLDMHPDLPTSQHYEIRIRLLKHALDGGNYQEAQSHIETLEKLELSPVERVQLKIQQGNLELRLGNLQRGLEIFRSAAQSSLEPELDKEWVLAENALGYGYRLTGDLDEAAHHYRKALKRALYQSYKTQQGWLLNNLAFIYALQGKIDNSMQLSDQALQVWEDVGFKRGLGAAHSTRASMYYKFGRFDKALEHFAMALSIFEPQNDLEWLSTCYCWRGVTLWALGNYDDARIDLESAYRIGLRRDLPTILNRLGRVYWAQGDHTRARSAFENSYRIARETHDGVYELVSLNDLAHLDADENNFARLDWYRETLEDYLQTWMRPDGMALGRMYRHMGTLALGLKRPDEALNYYLRGIKLIAEYGSYGWIKLVNELVDVEQNLVRLTDFEFIARLGTTLNELWETENLENASPEALPMFVRWEYWGKNTTQAGDTGVTA